MLRKYIENKLVIPAEIEDGNIEYKRRLDLIDKNKTKKMASQMLWRLNEGKILTGKCEAYYYLGINDDGTIGDIDEKVLDQSIGVIKAVADKCCAEIANVDKIFIDSFCVAEIAIHKKADGVFINEIRTCFLGPTNHGKSTIIGKLTHNQVDDGKGLARSLVLKHTHEQNSGITSSIKHDLIGFKANKLINYKHGIYSTWENIVLNSDKIIGIYDLPAFTNYARTTIFGILSLKPNINIIVVSPDLYFDSIDDITLSIKLSIFFDIPFIIIFTKADIKKPDVPIFNSINELFVKCKFSSVLTEFKDQIIFDNVVPYICVSNTVETECSVICDIINKFGNYVLNKIKLKDTVLSENIEYLINEVFQIPDTGIIASGLMINGKIDVGRDYLIGPIKGDFVPLNIRTIHRKQIDSKVIYTNETGCVEFKVKGDYDISKSLVIVDKFDMKNMVSNMYIDIFDDVELLKTGYQYSLHYNNNIEPIIIINIDKLRVYCKFVKEHKKYIKNNTNCVLRGDYKPDIFLFGKICL